MLRWPKSVFLYLSASLSAISLCGKSTKILSIAWQYSFSSINVSSCKSSCLRWFSRIFLRSRLGSLHCWSMVGSRPSSKLSRMLRRCSEVSSLSDLIFSAITFTRFCSMNFSERKQRLLGDNFQQNLSFTMVKIVIYLIKECHKLYSMHDCIMHLQSFLLFRLCIGDIIFV